MERGAGHVHKPGMSEEVRRPARLIQVLSIALLAVVALMILPHAGASVKRSAAAIRAPYYQLDNEEGALLFQALELRAGRNIYRRLTDYPFVAATYTPLYLAGSALLVDPAAPGFAGGRVLSLAGALGSAVLIGLLVLRRTQTPIAALAAALLFIATFEVCHWVGYFRVDLLGLMFTLGGLAAFTWIRNVRWRGIVSILLFVLGFYTRQTLLAAPAAVAIAYVFADRRLGVRYAAVLALALLLPGVLLTALTRGQFAVHTVWYNMNTYVPGDLLVWGKHMMRFSPFLVVAGLCSLLLLMGKQTTCADDRSIPQNALIVYCALALLTALAIGKSGSAENYLLEPLAALAILACTAASVLKRPVLRVGVLLLLVAHAAWLWIPNVRFIAFGPYMNPSRQELAAAASVTSAVRTEKGRTITELAILNLMARRSVEYQPFIMSELARQRKWDASSLHRDLLAGQFSLFVSNYDFASDEYTNVYTKELIGIMRSAFREEARVPGGRWTYYLYRSKR